MKTELHQGMTIRDLEKTVIRAERKAKVLHFPTRAVEVQPSQVLDIRSIFDFSEHLKDGE
jgi:hypothetical protein